MFHVHVWLSGQAGEEELDTAVGNARKAVTTMEATFGEANPRTSTAYGTLASILKSAPLLRAKHGVWEPRILCLHAFLASFQE